MSAIPWIGQDIVESTYTTIVNILKLAATLLFFIFNYKFYFLLMSDLELPGVSQICVTLPTIGVIHKNALKKFNKTIQSNKQEYISIPSSFLSFLSGLIDGDGYIQVTRTPKGFITIKLVISLHLNDLSTLYYIYSVIKIGKINIYKDLKNPICKLVINKTDLQEVLFPLLIHNNIFFLTKTRSNQFNLCMYIFEKSIYNYEDISDLNNIPNVYKIPDNPLNLTLLSFFKNWIVGFTNSEGSFFIKSNNDACFQLKQKQHIYIFQAFKLIFSTNRKINSISSYNQFSVSSKSDIQKVINFFSLSGLHPLVGLKYIQYIKWLNTLRKTTRYSGINYPNET